MRLLIDMDGVIADFERGILDFFRAKHPNESYIPLKERRNFKAGDDYEKLNPDFKGIIRDIYTSQGFYFSLQPIEGSLEALSEIEELGIQAFICTSPLSEYKNCVVEKYCWIDKYLGKDWVRRVVMTKDKTLIRADILIDDKLNVKGVETPSWEHVLYTQPYNRNIDVKRRLTWENWREVLLEINPKS